MPIPVIKEHNYAEGQRVKCSPASSNTGVVTGVVCGIAQQFQPYSGAIYIIRLDVALPAYPYSCTVVPESHLEAID